MLFNSLHYVVLLSFTVIAHWAFQSQRVRQYLLLVASLVFYGTWSIKYALLFLAIIGGNYVAAILTRARSKSVYTTLAVVISLGILGYYKYSNFVLSNLNEISSYFALAWRSDALNLILPLGISFSIFHIIAYTIDVKRGEIEPEKDYVLLSLFVLFFPQLIAGPICRATELLPQLKFRRRFNVDQFTDGLFMLLGGFVLKTSIADGMAPYVKVIFASPESYSGLDNFLGAIGFGIQIFCDFFGYSTMALGSAKLFGINLPFNFNLPYKAVSIQEFWHRWHMTLSRWLRDYLYISLGGSRNQPRLKVYRNLFLTMLLGGLWHGAAWTFVVWGIIHGVALLVHRWYAEFVKPKLPGFGNFGTVAGWVSTMIVVFIAWVFFRAENVHLAWIQIARILQFGPGWSKVHLDAHFFELLLLFLPLHWLVHRYSHDAPISGASTRVSYLLFPLLTIIGVLYYVDGQQFIYFQF